MNSSNPSVSPRQEVLVANHVLQACVCIYGALWMILAMIEMYNYTETVPGCRRRLHGSYTNNLRVALINPRISEERKKGNASLQHMLFANSIMSLGFITVLGLMAFWVPFLGDCVLFGRFASAMYTMTAQTALMFLKEKTRLVGDFVDGRAYTIIRKSASIAIMVFIPLGILPLGMYFTVGILLKPEEICTIIDGSDFMGYAFAVGNLVFSLMLMYLFVEPLRQNALRMSHGNRALSKRIAKVAIRNAYLAMASLGSSTAVSVLFSIFSGFARNNREQLEFLCIVNMILASTDITINGICIKAMSTLWMPQRIKRFFYPGEAHGANRLQQQRSSSSADLQPNQQATKSARIINNATTLFDYRQHSTSIRNHFSPFFLISAGGGSATDEDESSPGTVVKKSLSRDEPQSSSSRLFPIGSPPSSSASSPSTNRHSRGARLVDDFTGGSRKQVIAIEGGEDRPKSMMTVGDSDDEFVGGGGSRMVEGAKSRSNNPARHRTSSAYGEDEAVVVDHLDNLNCS